jgi:ABC-type multidrug transport system fused ATPase/permease subunit
VSPLDFAKRQARIRRGLSGFVLADGRNRRKQTVFLIVAGVFAAALRVTLPWPVKWILDKAVFFQDTSAIVLGIAAASVVLISAGALYLGWKVRNSLLERIDLISDRIRRSVLGYLQFVPEKEIGYHAESAVRFGQDLRTLSARLERGAAAVLLHSMTLIMTMVVMLVLDWRLGLITSLLLPLYWFPTPAMIRGIEARIRQQRPNREAMRRTSVPFVVGAATRLVMAAGVALVLWLGAGMIIGGGLSVGQLSVFLAYLVLARRPMEELQEAVVGLGEAPPARDEIEKLLLALGISSPEVPGRRPPRFEGRVGFYNVFASDGETELENISLQIRPERRTAFTGDDRKTRRRLLRMVLGLEQPDRGRVLVDGASVSDYDLEGLRWQIGGIPTDPILIDVSIREYVAAGEYEASEEAVLKALADAQLLEWTESLPNGIDTELNEYLSTLTKGKKRLLAMARAAFMDVPILLLDAPTSDLEDEEKRIVVLAIDSISRGKTTLLVTDDLRVASRFDTIVHVEEGQIVEQGSHDELIDAGGSYATQFRETSPGPVLYAAKTVQLRAVYEDRRKPENINPFVFLVGCPGSGVSLIKQMLEAHPMLAVADDTNFIPTVLKDSGAKSDIPLTDDLVDRSRTFPNFDRLGLDNVEVYKAGGMSETYSEFVTNLYNIFARKQKKELVAVKAPVYCRDIRLLHDLFPWARYIHIVRDGRDVAMSVLERATRLKEAIAATNVETVPIGASALWWKTMVETARRDGQRLGSSFYLEVRFEDLVDQPQTAVNQIASFLELSDTASLRAPMVGFATLDSVSNGFQDWRSQMRRTDVALFEALAGELLSSLSYGRGVSEIPEDIVEEAQRCLASWRSQKKTAPRGDRSLASSAG